MNMLKLTKKMTRYTQTKEQNEKETNQWKKEDGGSIMRKSIKK